MPTYRYKCPEGHHLERFCYIHEMEEFEKNSAFCNECGKPLERDWTMRKSPEFHEGIYEHLGPDPVYVSSMQQLRNEASRNGNRSLYHEDIGGAFRTKGNRWI